MDRTRATVHNLKPVHNFELHPVFPYPAEIKQLSAFLPSEAVQNNELGADFSCVILSQFPAG